MNKILRYSFVALLAMVFGNVMAEDVIWSEDFSSFAAKDVPTGGTYNYVCTGTTFEDGVAKSGTMIYDANLAGGTSPELLVAKNGGSFQATVDLEGKSGNMTLSFKSNKALTITVTGGTLGANTGTGYDYVYPITDASGSLVILFKMDANANARLDDIKLFQGQGKKPAGLSWGTSARTVTIGADDNVFPTLTNENNLAVTYSSSEQTVATIAADGTITLVTAGTTVITATSEETDEFEAGHAQYTLTVKEGLDPNAKGQKNNPYTVAEALEANNALDNGATTSDKFYVKGFVVGTPAIEKNNSGEFYGNANFYIADEKNGTTTLYCYRLYGLENAKIDSEDYIKENDELVVMGQFQKYVKDEVVTPEVKNGHIVSINVTPDPELPVVDVQPIYRFTANGQWASYTFNKANFKAAAITGFRIEYSDMTEVTEGAAFNILVNSAETHLGKDWAGNDAQVPNKTSYKNYGFDAAHTVFTGDFAEFVATDDPATTCPTIGQFALQACAAGNSVIIKKVVFIKADGTEILPEYKGDDWGGGGYTIEENPTGINNVNAAKAENAVRYNLAGQKVSNDYKGVVIENGKKVVVK